MSSSEEKLEALASFTSSLLATAATTTNERENEKENPDKTKMDDDNPTQEPVADVEPGSKDKTDNDTDPVEPPPKENGETRPHRDPVEALPEEDDETRQQLEEHLDLGGEIFEAHEEPETAPQSPDPVETVASGSALEPSEPVPEPSESAPLEVDPNDVTRSPARPEGSRPATPISKGSRPASPASPRDIEIEYKDDDDKVTFRNI